MTLRRSRCHRTSKRSAGVWLPATIVSSQSACSGRAVGDQPGQYGADMLTDPGVVFDAQTRLLVAVLAEH